MIVEGDSNGFNVIRQGTMLMLEGEEYVRSFCLVLKVIVSDLFSTRIECGEAKLK